MQGLVSRWMGGGASLYDYFNEWKTWAGKRRQARIKDEAEEKGAVLAAAEEGMNRWGRRRE
jgi:hypothetical protein